MLEMRYVNGKEKYEVNFKKVTDAVVELTGNFPVKKEGFVLSRPRVEDNWDYSEYKTIYLQVECGVQFSNDESVYVEPQNPVPLPEQKPYIPTLEETKMAKKQEVYVAYNADVAAGVDVELSTGTQHFPLQSEDREFLMGKQLELSGSDAEMVSYQDSDNHCMLLSRNDMQKIITEALAFVNFKTTYRNNLCEWVNQCETKEEVEEIFYGTSIPEEHQNEVFRMYLAQQEV